MAKPHTDLVVVCGGDGAMVGVLTKTDIVGQITQCAGGGCTARVNAIMTRDVVSCLPDEPLQGIWSVMKARGLQRIPVLDGTGKPVGILICAGCPSMPAGRGEERRGAPARLRDGWRIPVTGAGMPLPAGCVATRRTPVFTQDTVPPALLGMHETKGGAWAVIHVLEGKLRYCIDTPPSERILEPGQAGMIEPQVRHHVEPVGPVRFYLEFYRVP